MTVASVIQSIPDKISSVPPTVETETAARNTTASVMRHRGAPIASADSRSAFGTMHSMSSVVRRITGNMMIASAAACS